MVSVTQWREARLLSTNSNPRGKPRRTNDGTMVRELLRPAEGAVSSMAEAVLPPGKRTSLVRYRTAEVLCYILGGRGVVTISGQAVPIDAGEAVRIPAMAPHYFETVGTAPLRFLRCSLSAYAEADVELLDPVVKAPKPPAKAPVPVVRQPVVLHLPPFGAGKLRALRKNLGINQHQFWQRIFVTQSGGSRYESGRAIPKPTQLMLRLTYGSPRDAHALLAKLRQPFVDIPPPKASLLKAVRSGEGLIALRKALRLNQIPFWTGVGVTQSGGSRYESGREFSEAISILLRLVFSPERSAVALLEKLRSGKLPE